VPKPKKKKKSKGLIDRMMKLGYAAITEARTDWLTVETVFIAEHLGLQIDNIPDLSRKIRKVFLNQTEKLSEWALENDEITMGDVADAVRIHYTALPKGMFGEVQLPRHKSVDAVRLPPIKEEIIPRKVKTVKRKANKK
jgi:hypothetical protein